MPTIGANSCVHRLDRGVVAGHALLDIVRRALDHDDGVVDHDADREHDREQRRQVDGEAERRHRRERADDGDGHGGRRHQHRAPVLQEHQDHDQHQKARLDQGLVDLVDRGGDELGGVERRVVFDALREGAWRAPPSSSRPPARPRSALAPGDWNTPMPVGGLLVEREDLAVGLRAQLDRADVAHARHVAIAAGLDDDVLELARRRRAGR